MDRLNEPKKEKETSEKVGLISKIKGSIACEIQKRKIDKAAPVLDIITFLLGVVFSRCHIIFGSHPIAIAFISILPGRVWLAALGGVVGALSMGRSGLIYAMISSVVVFLRVIVSGSERTNDNDSTPESFRESILLRMSAALIGGFIGAVYEVLLSGFSLSSVLFGSCMILLPPMICFSMSGIFDTGVDIKRTISDSSPIFSLTGKDDKERYNLIFFQISSLFFAFFISISLAEFSVFGINLSYIFSAFVTLITARRFGALRAAAVGFASSFGLSSLYSAAFALLGLVSGVLFNIGTVYALVGGGAALCAWCAYSGGVTGFLSTLPEYSIAALLASPIIKQLSPERSEEETESTEREVSDMLGVAALSYKNRYTGSLDALEATLTSLSGMMKRYTEKSSRPTKEELEDLIDECAEK